MYWNECPNCELGGEKPSKELDEMVRDFTQVVPRAKSEVRSRLLAYRNTILEEVKKIEIDKAHTYASENAEIYRAFDDGQESFKQKILRVLTS